MNLLQHFDTFLILSCVLILKSLTHVESFQLIKTSNNLGSFNDIISQRIIETKLHGIDFDSIGEDEECDFTDGDLSQVDLSKCLPFPSPDIIAEDVVTLCMESLLCNDEPKLNAGLEVCYNFSSDRCRAANGPTLEDFIHFAGNPIFRLMVNAREYKTLSVGPEIIPGQGSVTSPGLGATRGAMKTVLISVTPRDTNLKERKFLWTLQKERRPPKQGCWLVHECITVENSFSQTI